MGRDMYSWKAKKADSFIFFRGRGKNSSKAERIDSSMMTGFAFLIQGE